MRTPGQAARLAWGKVRRFFLIHVFKERADEDLRRRRGACTQCGACCRLLFKCPGFKETETGGWCTVYNDRPGNCALFPINEKDLRDRNIVMPERACGFTFDPDSGGPAPEPSPLEAALTKLRESPGRQGWLGRTARILRLTV